MSERIFLTGAGRGLGLELVRQYLAAGARVFAAARNPDAPELVALGDAHPGALVRLRLDVTSDAELAAAVAQVRAQTTALDLVINNAAIHRRGMELGSFERQPMLDVLHTNAVAPMLVGQAFLELLRAGTNPRLVNISTQVGSFTWNRNGKSPLYAASKAALNMYVRAFAREAAGITTIAVHPGWVQTDMGGPEATLTKAQSVGHLRALFDRLTPSDNAQFFNYDGALHPW